MEKQQKHYKWCIFLFMMFLYATTASVFLNGDDFMYGTFAHQGILPPVWGYYHTGNGRFWINILDSTLLWFDRYLYILVTPWIILAFLWLMARNLELILGYQDNPQKHRLFMIWSMILFACMDVLCLRETVFWITGMMNYLFPATVFLLGYYWFQRSRQKPLARKWPYWILCFLAASSVEQYALMFLGMMTLQHIADLKQHKKIPAYEWIAYLFSLVGLAVLILAPGNFVRIGVHAQLQPPFLDNLWTLIVFDTMAPPAFPYFLMLNLLFLYGLTTEKEKSVCLCLAAVPPLLIAAVPQLQKAVLYVLYYLVAAALLGYTLIKKKFPLPVYFLLLVGAGSQLMLLISAIWGFRCMFSLYMVYMMMILVLLDRCCGVVQAEILLCGITSAFSPVLALVWCLICSSLQLFSRAKLPSLGCRKLLVGLCCVFSLLFLAVGYGCNVPTYRRNLEQTKQNSVQVVLQPVPKETYSWYYLPMGEFHEEFYRQYYQVGHTPIVYDLPEEREQE